MCMPATCARTKSQAVTRINSKPLSSMQLAKYDDDVIDGYYL